MTMRRCISSRGLSISWPQWHEDRDDEAKVRFLTKAIVGTIWGLSTLQRAPGETSYQRVINALHKYMRKRDEFESENIQKRGSRSSGFRESLWKPTSKAKKNVGVHSETFLGEICETFYTGQRRWGRNPRYIGRSSHSNDFFAKHKVVRPCFNCDKEGCFLWTCKKPKNYAKITENLYQWKQKENIRNDGQMINVAECVENPQGDDKLIEMLLEMSTVYDESSNEERPEQFDQRILHNRL